MSTSYRLSAATGLHKGDRPYQQDQVIMLAHPRVQGCVLAVVADGMGGHTGGVLAAQQVIHTSRNNLEQFSVRDEDPRDMLEASIKEAHMLIKASRFINEKDPHSTAVMLLLQPGKVSWAHCGDSRLYRFRGDRLLFRTTDHSYVETLVAKGRITPEQALVHPNRNILLTSLGGNEPPRIDYGEADDVQAGEVFVLCSDGVWGYFSDAELGSLVETYSAREACDRLIDRARTRAQGDGDNASLVVIKLLDAPQKPGKAKR